MRKLTADQQRVKGIVEAFNTPIVFEPGGWDQSLPDWIRLRVITERVEAVCNGGWNEATDAEVSCYLFTASLSHALDRDWTEITLYEAAKQVPQLREALPDTPKELSDYQKSELSRLKHDLRNSQLKRQNKGKKEETMPKRKIVIDEKEGSVMMGVMKEGADPFIKTVEGTLENALIGIPQLLQDAEAKWATSLKNPAYKAPPEPKKETAAPKTKAKAAAEKPAATKPTEDLPLLAETAVEKPAETAEIKPEEKPAAIAPVAAPVASEPAPTVISAPSPGPAPEPSPAAAPGQLKYYLEDGRRPLRYRAAGHGCARSG